MNIGTSIGMWAGDTKVEGRQDGYKHDGCTGNGKIF
jgi:hypothetical protein